MYALISDLLEYPHTNWPARLESARALLRESAEDNRFVEAIEKLHLNDLQELYTRTFDLNPVCALEVGYHLFGENYKRGEFLANLRETEAPFELGQQNQLPDYLPVLLRLLDKLEDEELRESLIAECLIPAIDKMLAALKDSENPYRSLLEILRTTLQSEVPVTSVAASRFNPRTNLPVLNHVANEMKNKLF